MAYACEKTIHFGVLHSKHKAMYVTVTDLSSSPSSRTKCPEAYNYALLDKIPRKPIIMHFMTKKACGLVAATHCHYSNGRPHCVAYKETSHGLCFVQS